MAATRNIASSSCSSVLGRSLYARSAARTPRALPSNTTSIRHSSSASSATLLASSAYTNPTTTAATTSQGTPPLPPHHRDTLTSLLRVDHSGEIAANTIYSAQARVFQHIRNDPQSTKLTLEMWESEKKHLKVAEMLLRQHGVRPSLLNPVWGAMGSLLGGVTALMGKEAAMACTEAVETVIGEHYDDQMSHLDEVLASFRSGVSSASSPSPSSSSSSVSEGSTSHEAHSAALSTAPTPNSTTPYQSLQTLRNLLEEFRDDELEHLDTAVEHDAQQAPAHALLSAIIGWGCKGAIEVAKRV